jgi:alkaline phosphatase D
MAPDRDRGYPARPGRRQALRAVASVGALPLVAALPAAAAGVLAFAPAAFDVHGEHALIWVSANTAVRVHVRWGLVPGALDRRSSELALEQGSDFTGHLRLDGLPAGVTVHYRVYANDTAISEAARFSTTRQAGQSFTIAFSGDMEEKYKPFAIFDVIAAAKPDFFVHLGDTVYADIPRREFSPTLKHYRHKHARIRADRPLQAFMAQCVTYATWDDHEIENDAHGGMAQLPIAEQVFREYWPCATVEKTGLHRAFSLSPQVDLIMLDTRRFRSVQALVDGPEKTMLGVRQKQWFLETLRRSRARFKIVATSVPFHGSSQDAWGNYKTERDEIVAFIQRERIANVVMISADYHFARDWSNKRTGLHEFMAGPLATFRTFDKHPETRERHSKGSHFVFGDDFNFGLLRFDAVTSSLAVSYQDSRGKVLFERTLSGV